MNINATPLEVGFSAALGSKIGDALVHGKPAQPVELIVHATPTAATYAVALLPSLFCFALASFAALGALVLGFSLISGLFGQH